MEFKLKAIPYYYDNGKKVNQASNKFKTDRKQADKKLTER